MRIENAVALVSGANRGIGKQFTRELPERGAAKVSAAWTGYRDVAISSRTLDDQRRRVLGPAPGGAES